MATTDKNDDAPAPASQPGPAERAGVGPVAPRTPPEGADQPAPESAPPTDAPPPGPFTAGSPQDNPDDGDDLIIDLQDSSRTNTSGPATEEQGAPAATTTLTREGGDEPAPAADARRLEEIQARMAAWEQARERVLATEADVVEHRRRVDALLASHDDRVTALERRQQQALTNLNALGDQVRAEIRLSGIASERRERFGDHDELRATVRTLLRRMSDGRPIDDDDRRELLALGHRTGDHWLSDAGRAVVAWAMGDEVRGDTAAERAMSTDDEPARWFLAAVAFTQPELTHRRWETLARGLERADPAASPVALDLAELALGDTAGTEGAMRAADLLTGWAGEPPGDPARHDGWVRRVARTATEVPDQGYEGLKRLECWDQLQAGLRALTVGEALQARMDHNAGVDDSPEAEDGDHIARGHLLSAIEALIDQPEPDEAELLAEELRLRDQVGRPRTQHRPRLPDLPDPDRLLWSLALGERSGELGPRATAVLRRTGRRWLATSLSEHLSVTRGFLPQTATVDIGSVKSFVLERPQPARTGISGPSTDPDAHADGGEQHRVHEHGAPQDQATAELEAGRPAASGPATAASASALNAARFLGNDADVNVNGTGDTSDRSSSSEAEPAKQPTLEQAITPPKPPAEGPDVAEEPSSDPGSGPTSAGTETETSDTSDATSFAPTKALQQALEAADGPEAKARPIGAIDVVGLIVAVVGLVLALTVTPWAWIAVGVGVAVFLVGMVLRRRRAARRRRKRREAHAEAQAELTALWTEWEAFWARVDTAEAANADLLDRLSRQR